MDANIIINNGIRQVKKKLFWNHYYNNVNTPKHDGPVVNTQEDIQKIVSDLTRNNFNVKEYNIDINGYKKYLEAAKYKNFKYYKGGTKRNFAEKSLEHYIAFELLGLDSNDIYIDIANANSPTPEIYHDLTGCTIYRQDLMFPDGVHGNVIGGDAGSLPLTDSFATKMGLHCSFEHFEGDSDIRFIREVNRILRPGGKVCILPLYLHTKYAIQSNPLRAVIDVEEDAVCYCAKDWGNRHGRFYDVSHLIKRVRNNLGDLKLTIYVVKNEKDVDPTCYVKFIGVFEKN